jgi:crotonobetainyl-CoA:carnitine CoA-transferase CaiB-like acyl-CoA transferase
VYACKGGGHYSVAALEPKFWSALCQALERPDLVDLQYSEDLAVQSAVAEIFASRSRGEWEQALSGVDACCEPVLDLDEVPSHPQIAARGLFARADRRPPPRLGEHTEEVLRELT